MTSFQDLGVPADLATVLERNGITEPFPIQIATIPDALRGADVCGKAPTGSGKTLAFGIPLVVHARSARPRRPVGLVLAPTRELASQIQTALRPLAAVRGRHVCAVYGGVGYERQRTQLRRGAEILIACPGRLRDLIDQRAVVLEDVEIVVIDEADRMADMGFLPQVQAILDLTSSRRQTLLFSATLDGDVAVLRRKYQRDDAVTHELANPADAADIEHHFEELERTARAERAAEVVRKHGSTILFTRTRHGADRLAKQLKSNGVDAAAIHGGLSQPKRDRALADFKNRKIDALVATDVAARGIHVDAVACVVHFDPPADAKTYVHRSGRTARAGATGTVVSLLTSDQLHASHQIRRQIGLSVESHGGRSTGPGQSKPGRPPRRARRRPRGARASSR